MEAVTQTMVNYMGSGAAWVIRLFLAVVVLIIGYIFSKIAAKVVRQILVTGDFDQRFGKALGLDSLTDGGEKPKRRIAHIIEILLFWTLLLVFFIFALEVLGDTTISMVLQNILTQMGMAVPKIVKAFLILAGAWILALVAKYLAVNAMRRFQLGDKLEKVLDADATEKEKADVVESAGNFVFYFIILLSLLPFLEALELHALVDPLKAMFSKVLVFLPNLIVAGAVMVLGYFFARLAERVANNFALAAGINRFVEGMKFESVLKSLNMARVIGTVVFLALMVPILGIAFQILDLPIITGVFATMMNRVAAAIPTVLGAFVLLILGLIAGRYLGDMVAKILSDVGFDVILSRVGLAHLDRKEGEEPLFKLSGVAGNLVAAVVVLFCVMEGFRLMNMLLIAEAINKLILYVPNVLMAFTILGLGFYLAGVVEQIVQRSFASDATLEAGVVGLVLRYAVIVFAFFMAFDELRIAHTVVTNAFAIGLGTLGLGLALAFGLGGRDHAGSYIETLIQRGRARKAGGDTAHKAAHKPKKEAPENPEG
jgi:hypothetical protein